MNIKWNEVTWYSRMVAIIFFFGVVPAISFDIGTQIAQISAEASGPVYIETHASTSDYKQAFASGQIPSSWSEYGNGFGASSVPVGDSKIISSAGGETYASHVLDSISPYPIVFSDVPYDRLDVFLITPQLRDKLVAQAQATNTYTSQTLGQNQFDVISFSGNREGAPDMEYIHQFPNASDGTPYIVLFIQYQSDYALFRKGVARYLASVLGAKR